MGMKIQTFSIVVGDSACNAHCPFCVSQMTPKCGIDEVETINIRNFHKSCQFAKDGGVSTVLLTGKGEPLLPKNRATIFTYLSQLEKYNFPFIELQTNGTEILRNISDAEFQKLYNLGVTTFIISCVHYDQIHNQKIYNKNYPDLSDLVKFLHAKGFSVRLSCVMLVDYIGDLSSLQRFIYKCKQWGVEQFTARPVVNAIDFESIKDKPMQDPTRTMYYWTEEQKNINMTQILGHFNFEKTTVPLLELMHGATVYDYDGQNVCLSNCLTESTSVDEVRQIIFFPDGHLRYSWKYPGAIIF